MAKWLHANSPVYESHAKEIETEARLERYQAELSRLFAEIVARPVACVADLVDRLILVTHELDSAWDVERDLVLRVLAGPLAAAGILVSDCQLNDAGDAAAVGEV
jgi:hypothetical protein